MVIKLDELNLSEQQKKELAELLDSIIHQTVLDICLSKLPDEDKHLFITKFRDNPEDVELIKFLGSKIDNIEEEILKIVEELVVELHKDIKEAKELKRGQYG